MIRPDGIPEVAKHVAIVCHAWYDDDYGGSFRLATEFAEFLAGQGHAVTFVCCAPQGKAGFPARENTRQVSIRRYPAPGAWMPHLARLRYHIRESGRCISEAGSERTIDVLAGHTPLQFLGAARQLQQTAFKTFFVHSPLDDELLANGCGKTGWKQRIRGRLGKWVDRRCVAWADRVHTASRYTLQSMIEKHGAVVRDKGIVVPGWVDAATFCPSADRSQTRGRLGADWNTDLPIFFTLRRHEARMGLDTLLDAVARVAGNGRSFRVLIGGDGALRPDLEQRARDLGLQGTVRFLGRLPEEQLPLCYAAADCFILPTRALECFGLIVLESFATGTPVIASRVAAIPELANVQGDDWLFEPGNAVDLAARMQAYLADRLTCRADLRAFALGFNRPQVLEKWSRLLLSDHH